MTGYVRCATPCPVCGEPYRLDALTTDAEGRIVHYLCDPRQAAEYAALVVVVGS